MEKEESLMKTSPHTSDNEVDVRSVKKYKWYHINYPILPSKLAFFSETARRIGFAPNLAPFLTSVGLNKAEAGFVNGFRFIGMLIGGPFWGIVADKWHCHRLIITIMCLTSIFFMCSQPFLSIHYGKKELNKCPIPTNYDQSTANVSLSMQNNNNSYNVSSNGRISNNDHISSKTSSEHFGALFIVMFVVNILMAFSEGSSIAFVDTATLRRAQLSKGRKVQYGRQRMFASFGGASGAVLTNLAIEYFPTANVTCYAGVALMYTGFTITFLIFNLILYRNVSFKATQGDESSKDLIPTKQKEELRKVLFSTLKKPDVAFFYLTTFVHGLVYSQYATFLYVYLEELNAPSTLLSLSMVVSNLSAALGFFVSHKLVALFRGTWNTIAFTFFVYFLRFLGRSQIINPWLILIFQGLHAISATLFVATGLNHLKETSPLPIITTLVSLFNVAYYGLGSIIGSSISGVVYEKFGGRKLFLGTSFIALFWSFVVVAYILLCKRKKSNQENDTTNDINELEQLNNEKD